MARIEITSIGTQKVKVIKAIRIISGAGLKEASEIADSIEQIGSRSIDVIQGMSVEEAIRILEAEGAVINRIKTTYENKINKDEDSIQPLSNADEIRKYKGLLDDGIITQQEFEAKKKQLLGLSENEIIEASTEKISSLDGIYNSEYKGSSFQKQVEKEKSKRDKETNLHQQKNIANTNTSKRFLEYDLFFIILLVLAIIPVFNIPSFVLGLIGIFQPGKKNKTRGALCVVIPCIIWYLILKPEKKQDTESNVSSSVQNSIESMDKNTDESKSNTKEHDHDVQGATCTNPGKCSICGEIIGEPLGHEKEEIDRKDATCQEEGFVEYRCNRCNEEWKEVIPVLNHAWGEGTIIEEATYTKTGLTRYTCTKCGELKEEVTPVREVINYNSLSEQDYKDVCKIEYYENFIRSKEDEGEYVKFHAYVSDRCFISVDDMYNTLMVDLFKKYDLKTGYNVVCVQSNDYKDNYGPDATIMYLDDSSFDYMNYKPGEYITIYGYCASNGGVYGTLVIPKYIEKSSYGEEW